MVHVKKNNVSMLLYHAVLKVFYDCRVESRSMIPIYSHYLRMMCYFYMCHLIVEKGLLLYHHQYAYCIVCLLRCVCDGFVLGCVGIAKVKMVYVMVSYYIVLVVLF